MAGPSASGYVYTSLSTNNSIRLLHIQPDNDACIRLTIEETDIDEALCKYNAVSHCWGTNTNCHKAWIGNDFLLLRDNYFTFICHCWRVSVQPAEIILASIEVRFVPLAKLWTDSISINRQDLKVKPSANRLH